jgi:hypothetical protein
VEVAHIDSYRLVKLHPKVIHLDQHITVNIERPILIFELSLNEGQLTSSD